MKIEYEEFIKCKNYKTAYNKLAKSINAIDPNSGFDDEYFNTLQETFGINNDIKEFWKYNENFFRLNIEQLDNNLFYIDCAYTNNEY